MKYLTFILLITAVAAVPRQKTQVPQPRDEDLEYRLPNNILPIHYDITLTPYLDVFAFDGYEIIIIQVYEATNVITLNARDVFPFSVNVIGSNETYLNVEQEVDENRQLLFLNLDDDLVVGNQYTVIISYWGTLGSEVIGFYRSSYVNEAGENVWLATTNFEPTGARRAFPSFDEPNFKATFTIRIYRDPDRLSISNLPLVSTEGPFEDRGGRYLDVFNTSVRMSTYLVAFVVSDFEYISNPDNNYRVFARAEAINSGQAQYGLDVGVAAIAALESLLDVDYTLPKIDQVAIPNFGYGAIDNWGLVAYREPNLLWSANTSTTNFKQLVATLIANEFSHQWFGNLVTPAWWDSVWLSEGFATYFSFYAADLIDVDHENTWQLRDQFATYYLQYAFGPDSLESARPMTYIAGDDPNSIAAVFDVFSSDKSGSVIRMVENFLTTSVFYEGLNLYLNDFAYTGAVPDDLFYSLQLAVEYYEDVNDRVLPEGLTVPDILNTWTLQSGYPLITVSVNQVSGRLVYTQERFLRNNVSSDQTTLWHVPINVATSANPDFDDTRATFWLSDRSAEDANQNSLAANWYILNKQQTGYYRVNYPLSNWQALGNYLNDPDNFATIHRVNRAQIIDDSFNLAVSGVLPYDVPLDISRYVQHETEYVPLYAFQSALNGFWRIIPNVDQRDLLESYLSSLFETSFDRFGIEESPDDSHTDILARNIVIRSACRLGLDACLNAAYERAERYLTNPEDSLSLDVQGAVFCGAIRSGNTELFDFLLDVYYNTADEEVSTRNAIIDALGCSPNVDLLNRLLTLSLDEESGIKVGDHRTSFQAVYEGSDEGVQVALDFLTNTELFQFEAAYTRDGVRTILLGLADYIYNEEQLQQFQTFADGIAGPEYSTTAENAAASARLFVSTLDTRVQQVNDWVARQLS